MDYIELESERFGARIWKGKKMVMKKKMLSACSIGMMLFVLTACGTKTQSVEQAKAGEESVTEQTESTVQEFVKKRKQMFWIL